MASKSSKLAAPTGQGRAVKLPSAITYGAGEPLLEGQCLDSRGRPTSIWTAIVLWPSLDRAGWRRLMTEAYGLKSRESIMAEAVLYDVQRTNRAFPLRGTSGRIVGYRVSVDRADRHTFEVRL